MRNIEKMLQYTHNEWDDTCVYTATDIAEVLCCNPRLARYYLMEMVKLGELRQIKIHGKTYYVKYYQVEQFKKFRNIGLTIK